MKRSASRSRSGSRRWARPRTGSFRCARPWRSAKRSAPSSSASRSPWGCTSATAAESVLGHRRQPGEAVDAPRVVLPAILGELLRALLFGPGIERGAMTLERIERDGVAARIGDALDVDDDDRAHVVRVGEVRAELREARVAGL